MWIVELDLLIFLAQPNSMGGSQVTQRVTGISVHVGDALDLPKQSA